MSSEATDVQPEPEGSRASSSLARHGLVGGFAMMLLVTLLAAVDSPPGHSLELAALSHVTLSDGLNLRARRMDGSIWSRITFRDLQVRDVRGVFATSPALSIDWRPAALIARQIRLRSVEAQRIDLLRAPALKLRAPKPNEPVLPNIHLTIGRLAVQNLRLAPAVAGSEQQLKLLGSGELRNERLRVTLDAEGRPLNGVGDRERLRLKLDAEPRANRLGVDAHLTAPAGGVVDGLLKLGGAVRFDMDGQGGWRQWTGRAQAQLGAARVLDAQVSASSGRFEARGWAAPAKLMRRTPVLQAMGSAGFDAKAHLVQRQLGFALTLTGRGVVGQARGELDLAHNRYQQVAVRAQLADPHMVGPAFSGVGLGAALRLGGPMSAPSLDWGLAATRLGIGKVTLEELRASGRGQGERGKPLALTITASAAKVNGLPAIVEPLTDQVRLNGAWRLVAGRIMGEGLQVTSSRVAARADVDMSPADGRYQVAARGRASGYPVQAVGPVDVDADFRFVPAGRDHIAIIGHGLAHTTRVEDDTLRALFGGEAQASADFAVDPQGAVQISRFALSSARLKAPEGWMRTTPQGVMTFAVDATSSVYGPLHLDATGPAERLALHVRAPRPNVAGLTDVDARLSTQGHSLWSLDAQAHSPFGASSAQARLDFGGKGLALNLTRGKLGEIGVSGPLRIDPPGVLSGTLRIAGSGLSGLAQLSGDGGVQRIIATLHARQARLDTHPAILIANGEGSFTALLKPGAPVVVGKADLSGLTRGRLRLGQAHLDVNYLGQAGHVAFSAKGEDRAPFNGAGVIDLSPDLVRVSGSGAANGVMVRLEHPAELRKLGGDWVLAPAIFDLPSGRVTLSGREGVHGISASAQMSSLDLAVLRAAAPDLALSGVASGTASINLPPGGAMPTGRVRMQVNRFSRAQLLTVTEPVDLALIGELDQSKGDVRALVQRRGAVVGRLQASLSPIGQGRSWFARLSGAPLTGGVRWNGPAELLWGLTGVSGQSVSGPVAIGADVTGSLDHPQARGIIRGQGLRYAEEQLGAVVDNISVDGRFTGDRLQIDRLTGRAGDGAIAMTGSADLAQAHGFPIDLNIVLSRARVARNASLGASVSGQLKISNDRAHGALISGKLGLDQANYQLGKTGGVETVELTGVRRKGDPTPASLTEPIGPAAAPVPPPGPPSAWKLNIAVAGAGAVRVTGMGLDAQWRPALTVTGDARHPTLTGEIDLIRGNFTFAGRMLGISRGVIRLTGADPPDPMLDIQASTTVEGVTANVIIGGLASHPEVTFTSTPALPQDEVLARLLFGSSAANISPIQAVELAASLNELRGGGGGLKSLGQLQRAAGLRFYAADKTTRRGAAFGAGRSITRNIYVEITSDTRGYAVTQIEVALSRALRLLSQVSTVGGSNLSLRYTKDY